MDITLDPLDVIEFNGVTSSSLGIIVDDYYTKGIPQRRVKSLTIPGKNGTVFEDEGVFDNCTQDYTLYWLPEHTKDSDVLDWLKQDGYYKWKHSSIPEHFQLARAIPSSTLINHRDCYHELKVTFSCKPEMYFISGDFIITASSTIQLQNPSLQTAKPKLTVYGNTDSPQAITVNNKVFTLNNIDEYTVLDSELQEAYKGSINKNNTVSGEFPVFVGGVISEISFSSGITKLEIQPRWWTL